MSNYFTGEKIMLGKHKVKMDSNHLHFSMHPTIDLTD